MIIRALLGVAMCVGLSAYGESSDGEGGLPAPIPPSRK